MMKLTFVFLFFVMLHISASEVHSQNSVLTLNMNLENLGEIINLIEEQSEFKVFYKNEQVDLDHEVSVESETATVSEILDDALEGADIDYTILDKVIVLTPRTEKSVKQEPTVTGTVKSADGTSLPGVNVFIKGSTVGTVTDVDGNYTLTMPEGAEMIQYSMVGYATQEIPYTGQITINIMMEMELAALDEVVVVGYGTQKKVTVTGSISSTSGEEVKKSPSANLTSSLAGRLPGVIIRQTRGELGYDDPLIRIRGVGTWRDANPLIIIDGIERSGLGRLDPNDIESITVLKDASAAIYGVRAANGVILVTTKRGKEGKPAFSFTYNHGIYQPTRIPEMMDAPTFAKVANENAEFKGRTNLPYTEEEIALIAADTSDRYPNTDWVDEVLKPYSIQKRYNLASSGGNENIRYFVSFGSLQQDPIFKNSNAAYTQYNLRSNIDFQVNKYLSVSLDVAGRIENRTRDILGATTTWVNTLNGSPVEHAIWPNGEYAPGRGFQSPLFLDQMGYYKQEDRPIETKAFFDFKIPFIQGLGVDGSFYADYSNRFRKVWVIPWEFTTWDPATDTYETDMTDTDISLEEYHSRHSAFTYNLRLKYNRSFNNHYIDAFVLWEQYESKSNNHTLRRSNFATMGIDQLFAGGDNKAIDWEQLTGVSYENARRNYLGRINYDYARKYMVQLQFRYDGSTRFPKANRYGFFPGVSAGWRISEERFMSNLSWLDNLKIRASYGQLGNDRVGNSDFPYLTVYKYREISEQTGMSVFVYNTADGYVGSKLIEKDVEPNLAITWETAEKYNLGLDGSVLNGKLDFVVELFQEKRNDILTSRLSVPATIGVSAEKLPEENIGKAKNHGFEVVLTHHNKIGDLRYSVSGNIAYARNEIVYWDEPEDIPEWQRREGNVIGSDLWYLSDGIYGDTNEINSSVHYDVRDIEDLQGTIKIIDRSGNDTISGEDMVRIDRSEIPELTFGFGFGAQYKGFDFSALLQGQARAHYYQALGASQQHYVLGEGENNLAFRAEDRWWYDNRDGTMPRVGDRISPVETDFYLFPGSFIRIKNIEIGYSLPVKLLNRISISKLRLYISGYNLYTFSKNKWIDPENDNRGKGELYNYPINRVYNFGINLTF